MYVSIDFGGCGGRQTTIYVYICAYVANDSSMVGMYVGMKSFGGHLEATQNQKKSETKRLVMMAYAHSETKRWLRSQQKTAQTNDGVGGGRNRLGEISRANFRHSRNEQQQKQQQEQQE